jgi:ferredoxin
MPGNFFPKTIDEDKNDEKVKEGLASARRYAEELIHGGAAWGRIPLLSDLFYLLCCNDFLMKNVNTAAGKKLTVDTDRCTQCKTCVKLCPTRNISLDEDGYPSFGEACEVCMRCLCFCPVEAISIPGKDFARYRAVKVRDLLSPR